MRTLRQEMIHKLEAGPMDIRELSQALGIPEKEVVIHLPHIAKSVTAKKMKFVMRPAYCESCNFTFANRQRVTRPSKCPRCRLSHIRGPWYKVTI